MTIKSKGELLGNVPVDTGYTPGEPTGVRAVEDVEYVTGAIHNRSLLDLWNNIDELDRDLRGMIPTRTFGEYTSAGDTERGITGDVYTGETTSDDNPSKLYERFRVTDQFGQQLMVNRRPVIVTEVVDPSASPASVVGVSRQILSGSTSLTFSLQTITHADGLLAFTYCKPGDVLVVSGGTSNDGTYIVEEVVASLRVRVRRVTGEEDAFNPGSETGTITVSTPEQYSHRIDALEGNDAVVRFNAEIPAATVYQVHYLQGKRWKSIERSDKNNIPHVAPVVRQEANLQRIWDGDAPNPKSPGGEAFTINPHENAFVLSPSSASEDISGSVLSMSHLSGGSGAQRQVLSAVGVLESRLSASQISSALGKTYTGLSVQSSFADKIVDLTAQHSGSDLTDIGSGIVQSSSTNWTSVGALAGMHLRIGSDPTVHIVTEVAPGGDTTRLRVTPTPAAFGPNEDFTLLSRRWAEETDELLLPLHASGILLRPLPTSTTGDVTKGSDILEDLSVDFSATGVAVGDKVYCTSRDMNCTKIYEVAVVAPGGNNNRLQLTEEIIETNAALSYEVYDPELLAGRGFIITDINGAEISVQMLNGISSSWSTDRDGIVMIISDNLSILDNFIEDGSGGDFLQQGTHVSIMRDGHVSGDANRGFQSVALLNHTKAAAAKGIESHAAITPADVSKGLTTIAGNAWVMIGDVTDNYAAAMELQRGDIIVPLVGPDKGTEFEISEVTGPYVKVAPNPSGTTVDYQYPFFVKRSPYYVTPDGHVYMRDLKFLVPQDRELLISPFEMREAGAPNAASGQFYDPAPSPPYHWVWESASTSWTIHHGLKLKPGDWFKWLEWRVGLTTSVSNPNTALTCGVQYQQIMDTNTLAGPTLSAPYLSGSGTLTVNSRVVNYSPGGLSGAVYPGCFVILNGTGAWRVAEVLDDNNLILAEDHGQATTTTTIVITNGRPLISTAPLPAADWLFVAVPTTITEVLSGQVYSCELNGPDIADKIYGARVMYRGERF